MQVSCLFQAAALPLYQAAALKAHLAQCVAEELNQFPSLYLLFPKQCESNRQKRGKYSLKTLGIPDQEHY